MHAVTAVLGLTLVLYANEPFKVLSRARNIIRLSSTGAREKDGEDNKSGKLRVIRGQIETNGPSLFSSFLFQGTEWTKVTIVCANPSTENKTNLLRFYFQWQNANHPLPHLCCKKDPFSLWLGRALQISSAEFYKPYKPLVEKFRAKSGKRACSEFRAKSALAHVHFPSGTFISDFRVRILVPCRLVPSQFISP